MLKRHKSRVHIANFEEGNRSAQVSLEFEITTEKEITFKKRFFRGLIFILFLPIVLPFKIIWYFLKNVVND